ncbi:MAG TPA: glycerophosphodiester phosphodiesterase family protein, partial [Terriglobia bacterium]|nr:glycerophosphodiester phosphodiesterase family protein [Terriglobia bacterium]
MLRPTLLTCVSLLLSIGVARARQVVVIAHRGGEYPHYPSNTLLTYRRAMKLGADFIETDVRTTADGKLVIMHNGDVDATTNGHGQVRDMTLAQILRLDAGVKYGPQFKGVRVPTLNQVLRLAEGHIGVYLDCKAVAPRALVAAIDRYHMENHVVIYGYTMTFLEGVHNLRPNLKVMPEAKTVALVDKEIQMLHPQVFAFSAGDWKDPIIAMARRTGADIYVDRLGPADLPASWQDAVNRGATGIQTNHP